MSRPTVLLAASLDWAGTARLPQAFRDAGFEVTVHAPPALLLTQSAHADERIGAPESLAEHLAQLRRLMQMRRFDHHVACDEPLLHALAAMREQAWTHPLLPTPPHGSHLDFVVSKLIFPATCARAALPVPETRIHADAAELQAAALALGFPLVAKLARGHGGLAMQALDTPRALADWLARWPAGTPVALQAFVPGTSGSCCAVWARGELQAWFAFHVVRSWPDGFSPSTVVRLVERPALEATLRAVGRLSAFHGLGGIDFIEQPDGRVVLTEQHARPIPQFVLAAEAGIDLPAALRSLVDPQSGPLQRPRIPAASADIPLFPQEALRMIGCGETDALRRWRTDARHRRQLFRAADRPLFAATLRQLRAQAQARWREPLAMRGNYINLERSAERRETMEAQLRRLALPWITRLRATDAAELPPRPASPLVPGEIGCFVSHLQAIEQVPPGTLGLVLEDDATLCEQLAEALTRIPLRELLACDIVLLDGQPMATTQNLMALWRSVQRHRQPPASAGEAQRIDGVDLHEARGLYLWATLGYVVTPRGRAVLPGLLRAALAAGPQEAFDTTLHRLIQEGRIRAALVAPFLATPRLECWEASTIAGRTQDAIAVVSAAMRRLFFAGDTGGAQAHAESVRHVPMTTDPDLQLLAELMARTFVAAAAAPPPPSA